MRIDIHTDDSAVVEAWTDRVPELVSLARGRLADDPGEVGLLYAEHHLAEIAPDTWASAWGLDAPPTPAELLRRLQPVALWGDPADGLHLDLSIGEELTDYVLTFEVRADGTLGEMDMES
ncbi:MAG: DUF2004 domain-containing protein [Deltaproteobacteria bacterium]|nr:MAG: DUF2004 domain-containing protein [Deltaproteobacteria bacterium]